MAALRITLAHAVWSCLLFFLWATPQLPQQKPDAPSTEVPRSTPPTAEPGFVLEQFYTSVHFEHDGTGTRETTVRARILNTSGAQQLSELTFGYDAACERVEVRSVRVTKKDGKTVSIGADAVKDVEAPAASDAPAYKNATEAHISIPALVPGDILFYEVVVHIERPAAPGQFWYEHSFLQDVSANDEQLKLDLPAARTILLRAVPPATSMRTREGRKIYAWALPPPSSIPNAAEKKNLARKAAAPAVQLTTFPSWAAVGRWYAKQQGARAALPREIRAKAKELTQGLTEREKKIRALYDFVSTRVRTVNLPLGTAGYRPHAASEVLKNQYGDSADKHILLTTLLAAIGVKAEAALLHTSRALDLSVPSPAQFDHILTAIPSDRRLTWLDTAPEVAPFRMLAPALRGKRALLVPVGPLAEPARFAETPADPPFLATQEVEMDGAVSELGRLAAQIRYRMRGDNELGLRAAFHSASPDRWKQLGQTMAYLDGLRGDVTSVKPSDPLATRDPFELRLEYSQADFLDWSAKKNRIVLPLPLIGMPDAPERASERVRLGSPLDLTMRLQLTLPPGYTARVPAGVSMERDYASYESRYKTEGSVFSAVRRIRFKAREVAAEHASDYQTLLRAVAADEAQALSLENPTANPSVIPATATADELNGAGAVALNAENAKLAAALFEREAALDPKYPRAWDNLGLARLRLGNLEGAVEAFRKQAELDAKDENAWRYLGLALAQQRKYEEAITTFHKEIELNPLDPLSRSTLGEILLQQRRYAEAAPELERAAVLSPQNAQLQVDLGQAYLNTNRASDALKAFDAAVELSPTPLIWNSVAFDLAVNELELDRAQKYAESALAATAAELRDANLEHLTRTALADVAALGNEWGTLGWIHFQRGDLDAAEQYLRAAWQLNQHGELGDHVGQLYEKRGQKDLAIQTYAQALATGNAPQETRGRLGALLGGDASVDAAVEKAREELTRARTFRLGSLNAGDTEAEFFILLAPEEKRARVQDARFITGNEKLRSAATRLHKIEFGNVFPDLTATQIVRRGVLSCSAAANECVFVLILPENVRSLN